VSDLLVNQDENSGAREASGLMDILMLMTAERMMSVPTSNMDGGQAEKMSKRELAKNIVREAR
jgi:hypothetical protein